MVETPDGQDSPSVVIMLGGLVRLLLAVPPLSAGDFLTGKARPSGSSFCSRPAGPPRVLSPPRLATRWEMEQMCSLTSGPCRLLGLCQVLRETWGLDDHETPTLPPPTSLQDRPLPCDSQ